MLAGRRLLLYPRRCFSSSPSPHRLGNNVPAFLRPNPSPHPAGLVSDLLEIIGPLEDFFPSPTRRRFYVGELKHCINDKDFDGGRLIHVLLIKLGFRGDCFVDNVLLDMYVKLGSLSDGVQLFDEMRVRNVVSWCTLIAGFVDRGLDLEGLCLFEEMVEGGLQPNHFVLASVIKACAGAESLKLGVQLHCSSTKSGLLLDGFVLTGLIDMYAKCGCLRDSHNLSGEVLVKTPASWNTLISGYIWNFQFEEALKTCLQMLREGCMMDTVTLRSVSSAVSNLQSINFGNNLYAYSTKIGLSTDYFFVLELLKLWAMVGEVDFLWKVFHAFENRDATMYSCVISTFHQHGCNFEALQAANGLLASNVNMNQGAIISLLIMCQTVEEGACVELRFMEFGCQIHACITKTGYEHFDAVIGNAITNLHIKCSNLDGACKSFDNIICKDPNSYSSLMAGFVQNKDSIKALKLFHQMERSGLRPNSASCSLVLRACTDIAAVCLGE